jgi:hypothetical protein
MDGPGVHDGCSLGQLVLRLPPLGSAGVTHGGLPSAVFCRQRFELFTPALCLDSSQQSVVVVGSGGSVLHSAPVFLL